jgi:DNA adenine methylase
MEYKKLKGEIKSPLRYPGGKSKAIEQIIPYIPEFKEFREPFVGGGSVFIALKQRVSSDIPFTINDLNNDLYCFWKILKENPDELIQKINEIKVQYSDSNSFNEMMHTWDYQSDFDKAVRFFIINRSSFSGLSDSGGFSQQAFEKRFTPSSIERLSVLKPIIKDVQIFNEDYEKILSKEGDDVFIFLDPPYLKATKKRLYGKDGDLHLSFDHERFAHNMEKCTHKWLITYDDTPKIRELFHFANIKKWQLQYGMNNFMQEHAEKGSELFITNYDLDFMKDENISKVPNKSKKVPNKSKKVPLDNFVSLTKVE